MLLGVSKRNLMAKIMKQQDCIANFCASSQPHRRSPRSHPTASESSPFICILSNFLSSVLVLIVIIGLQWFLTTTVNTGNMGTTVAFTGLKYPRLPPWNTVQNKRGNPQVHSGEPQASRWFIYQQFFLFYPWFSGCAHLSPLIIYSHAVWCTVQNYSSDLPAGKS